MSYWEWGASDAPHTVLCVHGLSRQGLDFSVLAAHLCAAAPAPLRVLAVDVVGRGNSDWLPDPAGYQFPTYAADMLVLVRALAEAGTRRLDWVGTSMGGVIGMILHGSRALAELPGRLVLNDVGPVTQWGSIERIRSYLGRAPDFDTPEDAYAYLREISQGFGPHTSAQWEALSKPMLRKAESGRLRLHYDPRISVPLGAVTPEALAQGEAALWAMYDAISATTLLLRGADSDLLTRETARAMGERGPHARCVEFAGVGHAPTLVAPDQVQAVADFLLRAQA